MNATYRLQLNAAFTLHDAHARIPYLRALGVSHLYLSPVLAARKGSTHGYDVTDPTQVSAALGGDEALIALADAAHQHDMGIVLDIVPNHMGIGPDNPYWDDVLAHGHRSRYADWFDVNWRAAAKRLSGKVLVPILGDTLENVMARSEITLDASELGVRVRYFDHHLPVDPATLPPELELAMRDPSAREGLYAWGRGANGAARLRALLGAQHYELAYWRSAQRDLNYRRFFDVNELICLRVEREDVFTATHRTVLEFVVAGVVDGLRVDHIDGLLEPRRYLERLRAAVDARRPARPPEPRFPIFVEKILAASETLPENWPVDGTTGYEFMTALEDVFIDPNGYATIEAKYRGARKDVGFREVAVNAKRRVLRSALNADVRRIAPMLAGLARQAGWPHRTVAHYAGAIVEVSAALSVYRTYIDAECPEPIARDRAVLTEAFAAVRAGNEVDVQSLDALEHVLLGAWRTAEPSRAASRLAFVLRLQQLTGPAAAKGVEDTALYAYAPLASRCEVGGDPAVPVVGAVARLHERLAERATRHPRSLNATNTHDTKRSADVRARIDALSENPDAWERSLRLWRRRHRAFHTLVNGRLVPTRTTDDFIYQALLGIWPLTAKARTDETWLPLLRERLAEYIRKAMREAKVNTTWTDPDSQYEQAITDFLARALEPSANREFLRELDQFVGVVAPPAMWNALGRLVVHLTAPGVPDVYQGDELWFSALVDPDNRRPVDWVERERVLEEVGPVALSGNRDAQLKSWRDAFDASALKMYVLRELLALRRARPELFGQGTYTPLHVSGAHAESVFAFRRVAGSSEAIVAVARLTGAVGGIPVGDVWGDTRIDTGHGNGAGRGWSCAIHGVNIQGGARAGLSVSELFGVVPVAVLSR